MEKKLIREININLNSTKLKKKNIVKSGQKITGKISLKKNQLYNL